MALNIPPCASIFLAQTVNSFFSSGSWKLMELLFAVMSSPYNHLIFQTEPRPAGFCPTTALQGCF